MRENKQGIARKNKILKAILVCLKNDVDIIDKTTYCSLITFD
jgi:hypothetical protein